MGCCYSRWPQCGSPEQKVEVVQQEVCIRERSHLTLLVSSLAVISIAMDRPLSCPLEADMLVAGAHCGHRLVVALSPFRTAAVCRSST